jgi:acyl-CoA synthetase (AMP-forming)/AMP-acid ligase II
LVNLCLLLDMAVDGFGDRTVLGPIGSGLTPARVRELSVGGSRMIIESGAEAVVYLGPNGPLFPIALFSAARAGVPLVPVNYRLGTEQLDRLLASHQNAIGLAGPEQVGRLRAAGLRSFLRSDWLARIAELAGDAELTGEDGDPVEPPGPAVIIYTSGTTAAPKGVLIRHENLAAYVFATVAFAGAQESETALVSVPPYHIAAVANVITNLYAGRRAIVLEQFTAVEWLNVVREERITNALVVPTMLARILDAPGEQLDVPSLRVLAYGGAPMPAHVVERALQRWPHVDFVNAYGLTETSSTIAVLGPQDHRAAIISDDPKIRARLGSVGVIVPGMALQIRDEVGDEVAPGGTGRVWVRGDQVSAQYAGRDRELDSGGWFDTRDLGYLDEDGYLFLGGRADDTIIRGAENIAPAEIEDVLLAHQDVDDAVVVGIPDAEWGQRIEAAVVLRTGATARPADLREHVRTHLRGSKTPDRIAIWDELPRTETGKLIRRRAAERITAEANGQ